MPIYMKVSSQKGLNVAPGTVQAAQFVDWIELESCQMSHISPTPGGGPSRDASPRPSISEINVTKLNDKSSPKLFQFATAGSSDLYFADIAFIDADGVAYVRYHLTGVMISSYSVSGGQDRPIESITLNATKIEYEVAKPKN